ncbi:hypothetical protein SSP35_17_00650 [Streptomyces sp. NBRC 110611]|uniref:thiol-activated cytolysin family protein n=1 Tax=Streptomyces sp. NBRC 110611 TaxID=1621259 RepID=UPI000856811B|nr:thiol-activated cytolysin family protein [Streptomyces sp. NBRC 110611]GAU70210.1 hypothetical protein SSP35_17_00650 [Streptomyces sp. NBRC 110611]
MADSGDAAREEDAVKGAPEISAFGTSIRSGERLLLEWPEVPGADRYEVWRVRPDGSPWDDEVFATDNTGLDLPVPQDAENSALAAFQLQALSCSAPICTFPIVPSEARSDAPQGERRLVQRAPEAPEPFDLDNYFLGLEDWARLAPQYKREVRTPLGDPVRNTEQDDSGSYLVVTQRYSLSKTPKYRVVHDPDAEVLWPGAFIQGQPASYGALPELVIDQRTPIQVAISAVNVKKTSEEIAEPGHANVISAISGMINDEPGRAEAVAYDMTEVASLESALLELDISASYLGFSGGITGSIETKKDEKSILAFYYQRAFTVSCNGKSAPSRWFTDDMTEGEIRLQEKLGRLGKQNPPLYVSSVTYGRFLIFAFTTKEDTLTAKMAIRASYGGFVDATVRGRYEKILSEARIQIIAQGGKDTNVPALIKTGRLAEYFEEAPSLADYTPIGFTLKSLVTGYVAKLGETANFTSVRREKLPSNVVRIFPVSLCVEIDMVIGKWPVGPVTLKPRNVYAGERPSGTESISGTLEDRGTRYAAHNEGWEWSGSRGQPPPYPQTSNLFCLTGDFNGGYISFEPRIGYTMLRSPGVQRVAVHHGDAFISGKRYDCTITFEFRARVGD